MIQEFDPVIYPYKVWIVVNDTPDIIEDKFNEYIDISIENIEKDTMMLEAFSMPVINKANPEYGVLIFFRNTESMTFELVAHESSHAAKYLCEHIGLDMTVHEPFEYLIGWIAGCCEKVKNI